MIPNLPATPVADAIAKIAENGASAGEMFEMLPTAALRAVKVCIESQVTVEGTQLAAATVEGLGLNILAAHIGRRHDALHAFLHVLTAELKERGEE